MTPQRGTESGRGRITIERFYRAAIEDVWDLWTTKDGIVTVQKLDLRPGCQLLYAMTAIDPPQVEFMKKAGMPLSHDARITYTEVSPPHRLAYIHLADFIPGVEPYDVATVVELESRSEGVRMVLTLDPMHNDEWTSRAVAGWESELGKLEAILSKAASRSR